MTMAENISRFSGKVYMLQSARLEDALRQMMGAYERRIRSECKTPEELETKPWRCAEFVQAERVLASCEEPSAGPDIATGK